MTTISTSTTPVAVTAAGDAVTVDITPATVSVTAGVAGPQGPAVSLGTATPSTAGTATATAGTATTASASDHRHALGAHASTHAAAGSDPITISESQVTGLTSSLASKAATTSVFSALHLPMTPSSYFSPSLLGSTQVMYEGEETALVFIPLRSCTLDRIAISTTASASSGGVVRFGIRQYNATTGYPGDLIADLGTVDTTVAPGLLALTISQPVTAMTPYVLTATCQGGATTKPTIAKFNAMVFPWPLAGHGNTPYAYKSGVSGALNNTGGWAIGNALTPRIFVRTSA